MVGQGRSDRGKEPGRERSDCREGDLSQPLAPQSPGTRQALDAFLATSGTILLGQIDGRGVVVAANRALGGRIGRGPEPRLEAALRPRSRARWRRVLRNPGRGRRLTLWFGPGRAGRAAFRCWLVHEEGGTVWLFGEPGPAPVPALTGPGAGEAGEGNAATHALRVELARVRRRARRLGGTDALTGLANRKLGLRRLAAWVGRARRRGTPLACLMIDLDRFKEINDNFGHTVGDRVLRAAARALARGLRGSDLVARYGGDEFLVLLPATTTADALAIADRLRARLARRQIAPLTEPLDAGIGVAMLGPDESARRLLIRADEALIGVKRAGRGRVALAPPPGERRPAAPGEATETG